MKLPNWGLLFVDVQDKQNQNLATSYQADGSKYLVSLLLLDLSRKRMSKAVNLHITLASFSLSTKVNVSSNLPRSGSSEPRSSCKLP